MMTLTQFIPQLIHDYQLGNANLATGTPGAYALPLEKDFTINLVEVPDGFIISTDAAPFPKTRGELFATNVMQANLFGKETHSAVLGLSPDGNTLRLNLVVDYRVDYKEFMGILEDFITTVDFWRGEASK